MTVCIAFIFNIKGVEIHEGGGIATLENKRNEKRISNTIIIWKS